MPRNRPRAPTKCQIAFRIARPPRTERCFIAGPRHVPLAAYPSRYHSAPVFERARSLDGEKRSATHNLILQRGSRELAHTGDDGCQPATAAFWGSAVADGHRPSICDNVLYPAWNCWHCDSQPVFAIRGDVGDQSVFEGDFLDFAGKPVTAKRMKRMGYLSRTQRLTGSKCSSM
jgi:hypothetical protein